MPRSVKDPSGDFETIYIDGEEFRRDLPERDTKPRGFGHQRPSDRHSTEEEFITRAVGGNDPAHRIKDLDDEGIWGEVIYPSLGIWTFNIRTPRVVKAGCRALNDWALAFQQHSPRFVVHGIGSAGRHRRRGRRGDACARRQGFKAGFLPVCPPAGRPQWNDEEWDPLWAAFAETGMVIGFHIGTEPHTRPRERVSTTAAVAGRF